MKETLGTTTAPYLLSPREVAESFWTSMNDGISSSDVERRRRQFGWNEISQRDYSIFRTLLRRIVSVLTLILIASAILSLFVGEISDAIIIGIALAFDIVFGIAYESYSRYKIELIKMQVPRIAEVVREGELSIIPVRELVPGDVCHLREGERVPADIRLTSVRGFRVDESMLTGEPGDTEKITTALHAEAVLGDQRNMVFGGTLVAAGSARGIVIATGARSIIGLLAKRVVEAGTQATPLERRLQILGALLGVGLVVVSSLLFVVGLLSGESPVTMFRQALTLVVAAIPEDLTLILTIALAVGAKRLLGSGGVVRQLTAAETLGDATIICTDKTGTLTTGQISLVRIEGTSDVWRVGATAPPAPHETAENADAHLRLALTASLAGADIVHGTRGAVSLRGFHHERALAEAAKTRGMALSELRRTYPLFDTLVFDPMNRYRASLHDDPLRPEPIVFVVGAPDVLIPHCIAASDGSKSLRFSNEQRERLVERTAELAGQGNRVLTAAFRHLPRDARTITTKDVTELTFIALLVFEDPLRPDARAAVRELQQSGVRMLLLTGDHHGTAEAVAQTLGILRAHERVVDGTAIGTMSDELLGEELKSIAAIARVDPLQKERIVQILQRQGEIVGMIGDGVNDAVALRRADLGVAVGSATDVANDASDLVLIHESIATLHAAVREGRRIRETVRTVLSFLFATNVTEVLALFGALFLGLPLPFLPAMLLWINIVTDGTADIALALEPASSRPGDATPGRRRSIFRQRDVLTMVVSSLWMLVPTMLAYILALHGTGDVAVARTIAFVSLASVQLFSAIFYRSLDRLVIFLNPFGNVWLLGALASSFALLVAAVEWPLLQRLLGTAPLSRNEWIFAIVAASIGALGVEIRKLFSRRHAAERSVTSAPRRNPLLARLGA